MACRDCAYFNLEAAKDKAGRVLSNRHVSCRWVSTEPWPTSLSYGAHRPRGGFTSANGGVDCPAFKPREERDEP